MAAANSKHSLAELSARFDLELRGDPDHLIDGVGTLMTAGSSQVSFLANRSYLKELPDTSAGAVILKAGDVDRCPAHSLVASDPYLAFARISALFDPRPEPRPGIHPTAVIADTATVGENASIGANAVIGENCVIGAGSAIGPGTVIEDNCKLGEGCRLYANVSLGFGVILGKRVMVHPGAVIGADGFGIAFAGDHWEKVPQLGGVRIGDDCEIGANSCIDRGAIDDTVLEEDVRLDNHVQIAHNVRVGAHSALAGRTGVAGSAKIGRFCLLGAGAGVVGHLEIADRTTVAADSAVFRSISEPGTTWSAGLAARPIREWQKISARLNKLDELARRLIKIERELGKSESNE